MKIRGLDIEGLFVIEPDVYRDDRGYFMESHNKKSFEQLTGLELSFVQDNESMSNRGVLRGLHFQVPPHAQDKLVRVVKGKVLDIAVDLRKDSVTYGKYEGVILSGENKEQLFIPRGFAHGFLVLEDETVFSYKCSSYYQKESERSMRWDDPDINIDWGIKSPILSNKDSNATLTLSEFESPFVLP